MHSCKDGDSNIPDFFFLFSLILLSSWSYVCVTLSQAQLVSCLLFKCVYLTLLMRRRRDWSAKWKAKTWLMHQVILTNRHEHGVTNIACGTQIFFFPLCWVHSYRFIMLHFFKFLQFRLSNEHHYELDSFSVFKGVIKSRWVYSGVRPIYSDLHIAKMTFRKGF